MLDQWAFKLATLTFTVAQGRDCNRHPWMSSTGNTSKRAAQLVLARTYPLGRGLQVRATLQLVKLSPAASPIICWKLMVEMSQRLCPPTRSNSGPRPELHSVTWHIAHEEVLAVVKRWLLRVSCM